MTITSFQLMKSLREKLGEEEAESLVTFIEQNVKDEFDSKKEILAIKQDVYILKDDISALKDRMDSHFKWLIGLFIGQMVFILGLVYFILNYLQK